MKMYENVNIIHVFLWLRKGTSAWWTAVRKTLTGGRTSLLLWVLRGSSSCHILHTDIWQIVWEHLTCRRRSTRWEEAVRKETETAKILISSSWDEFSRTGTRLQYHNIFSSFVTGYVVNVICKHSIITLAFMFMLFGRRLYPTRSQ